MKIHKPRTREWLLLLIVLFVAAVMRVDLPGIVEFFHDDAMLSSLAQEQASGQQFHLTGIISSVGIPNPPASVYVMAIPFSISNDPNFAIYFVMALNIIGVAILWWMAHRYFGRWVALVAGLTYAVNPWAVLYSRKIWAQDFHTPFLLLAFALGLYGFWEAQNPRSRLRQFAQITCLPLLVFGMQIHFAGWLLAPLYLILLWFGRKQIQWRNLLISVALAGLVLLPYLMGLTQTLQADPTRITDAAGRSEINEGVRLTWDALRFTAYHATGLGMETWVAPDQQTDLLRDVPPPAPLWMIPGLLVLIGILTALYQLYRHDGESVISAQWAIFILTWAFFPLLIFIPNWTPAYSHYLIASIPALALLTGIGLQCLSQVMLRFMPQESRVGVLVVFAAVMLTQVVWWRELLRWLDTNEVAYPGFTTPIHYLNTVRDELLAYDDVVVLSHGMAWNLHHESVVWSVMLNEHVECVRTLQGDGYAVFPEGEFAVLYTPDAPENAVDNRYLTDTPESIRTRRGGGEYVIHHFDSAPVNPQNFQSITPVTFESGVQLTGYHIEDGQLYLEWMLPPAVPGLDYQYSGQLLNGDGERVAQADARFWHGRHWCADDKLLTWTPLDLPDEAQILRVSLYTLGSHEDEIQFFNANILDEMGNPAGQWVDIPLPD